MVRWRCRLPAEYGFQPMAASLFDTTSFYFYLTLTDGETIVQIPLPEGLSEEATARGVEEGLKRFASGLLKTVALMAPEANPYAGMMGQAPAGNQFRQLTEFLQGDFNVEIDPARRRAGTGIGRPADGHRSGRVWIRSRPSPSISSSCRVAPWLWPHRLTTRPCSSNR